MTLSASVLLATCNGEAYIEPLLKSIMRQRRAPSELLVSDDASEDGTVGAIERFAEEAAFPVLLQRNDVRLGVVTNFERLVERASGDVIFLCDQDDVWLPEKVACLMDVFQDRPDVIGVFSDSFLVDSSGDRRRGTFWSTIHCRAADRAALADGRGLIELVTRPCVPGHALGFRSSARELILPLSRGCLHDMWISRLLAGVGGLLAVEQPLVEYRLHGANAAGLRANARRAFSRDAWNAPGQWAQEAVATEELIGRLHERAPGVLGTADEAALRERASFLEHRSLLPRGRLHRIRPITAEIVSGRYSRYSNGLRSIGLDLLRQVD